MKILIEKIRRKNKRKNKRNNNKYNKSKFVKNVIINKNI